MGRVLPFRRSRPAPVVCLRCREVTMGAHRCEPLAFVAPSRWEPHYGLLALGFAALALLVAWLGWPT